MTQNQHNENIIAEYKHENERLRKKLNETVIPIRDQTVYYCALSFSVLTIITLLIAVAFYGS